MSSNYESVFDNDSVRIKLADTEDGIALSLDLMDGGESTAGTTLYLGQEQIDGVCAWLEKYRSARPEVACTPDYYLDTTEYNIYHTLEVAKMHGCIDSELIPLCVCAPSPLARRENMENAAQPLPPDSSAAGAAPLLEAISDLEREQDGGWSPAACSHLRRVRAFANMLTSV